MTATTTSAAPGETLIQLIKGAYFDLLAAFARHAGMPQARLLLLAHLRRAEALSQADLQQRLGVDAAAITRQVKQLEAEGLVARRAAPYDNRFTLVSLTAEGRRLADQLVDRREAFEASVTAGIDAEELATALRCLRRLRENARALAGEPPPG